ncbi:hypothetical protein HHL22_23060 [Hymenobacter sp. RP-2-7]|uniref:Uncharacterized protein n=1 Tax=Hymenobacter polaris TaxID=2682546 RepID=A0A7Y0AIP0_9BACT|nr:hypothetical protein [Hymenobacter polaris]NML68089.1 hypothetical protein [Hymenobacter polaris]
MELDDLRRQWQQSEPAPPASLAHMLGKAPLGLIERMRRNAWAEIIAAPVFVLLPLLLLPGGLFRWLYIGVMVVLVAIMGAYYARQLRLLRQMEQAEVSIKGHLQVLCAGLRQLLLFYYRLTIWTGPLTLLVVLGYYLGHELARAAGPRWPLIGYVAGATLLLGVLFQLGVIRFTHWYLQRLYGRHLDRLESQLRELNEGELTT